MFRSRASLRSLITALDHLTNGSALKSQARRTVATLDTLTSRNLFAGLDNARNMVTARPRVMLPRPLRLGPPRAARRINFLLNGLPRAERYLEIGVAEGFTLENVAAAARWGVDPAPRFDTSRLPKEVAFFHGTSDDFFKELPRDVLFDVAFLDGLHTFEQTLKDILNTFGHMPDGAILIDDTVPYDEVSAMPDQDASLARRRELGSEKTLWHGDVWKVVVFASLHLPAVDFRTITGPGNAQTLMWRKHSESELGEPSVHAVVEVAASTYAEAFSDGLPEMFRPCEEHEALSACLKSLASRR